MEIMYLIACRLLCACPKPYLEGEQKNQVYSQCLAANHHAQRHKWSSHSHSLPVASTLARNILVGNSLHCTALLVTDYAIGFHCTVQTTVSP